MDGSEIDGDRVGIEEPSDARSSQSVISSQRIADQQFDLVHIKTEQGDKINLLVPDVPAIKNHQVIPSWPGGCIRSDDKAAAEWTPTEVENALPLRFQASTHVVVNDASGSLVVKSFSEAWKIVLQTHPGTRLFPGVTSNGNDAGEERKMTFTQARPLKLKPVGSLSEIISIVGRDAFLKSGVCKFCVNWKVNNGNFSPCGVALVATKQLLTGKGPVVLMQRDKID